MVDNDHHCVNVRIRNGHVIGDCLRKPAWHCPYCNADRCSSHAPSGICGACGMPTQRINRAVKTYLSPTQQKVHSRQDAVLHKRTINRKDTI